MFERVSFTKLILLLIMGILSCLTVGAGLYQLVEKVKLNVITSAQTHKRAAAARSSSTPDHEAISDELNNNCLTIEDFNQLAAISKLNIVSITQNNVSHEFDHMGLKKISLQGRWSNWLALRNTLLNLPYFVLSESISANRTQGNILFTIEGWFCNT